MERLEKLEQKQDLMMEKLQDIAISTAENTAGLREHMAQTLEVRKQTEILKQMHETLKEQTDAKFSKRDEALDKRLKPLEKFAEKAKNFITYICYTGTVILALEKLGLLDLLFSIK